MGAGWILLGHDEKLQLLAIRLSRPKSRRSAPQPSTDVMQVAQPAALKCDFQGPEDRSWHESDVTLR